MLLHHIHHCLVINMCFLLTFVSSCVFYSDLYLHVFFTQICIFMFFYSHLYLHVFFYLHLYLHRYTIGCLKMCILVNWPRYFCEMTCIIHSMLSNISFICIDVLRERLGKYLCHRLRYFLLFFVCMSNEFTDFLSVILLIYYVVSLSS
jgi:hypothetical protein